MPTPQALSKPGFYAISSDDFAVTAVLVCVAHDGAVVQLKPSAPFEPDGVLAPDGWCREISAIGPFPHPHAALCAVIARAAEKGSHA